MIFLMLFILLTYITTNAMEMSSPNLHIPLNPHMVAALFSNYQKDAWKRLSPIERNALKEYKKNSKKSQQALQSLITHISKLAQQKNYLIYECETDQLKEYIINHVLTEKNEDTL